MQDRERFLALLRDFGITPEERTSEAWEHDGEGRHRVTLEANVGGVEGYSYFRCVFTFEPDGKFVNVGVWE